MPGIRSERALPARVDEALLIPTLESVSYALFARMRTFSNVRTNARRQHMIYR